MKTPSAGKGGRLESTALLQPQTGVQSNNAIALRHRGLTQTAWQQGLRERQGLPCGRAGRSSRSSRSACWPRSPAATTIASCLPVAARRSAANTDWGFCKHMVATALAADEAPAETADSATALGRNRWPCRHGLRYSGALHLRRASTSGSLPVFLKRRSQQSPAISRSSEPRERKQKGRQ